MTRKRRYTNKPRRRSSSPRAKPIKLDPTVWLRNSKDIADYRASELIDTDYKCAVSGLPLNLSNSTLDHAHADAGGGVDGRVRSVLQAEVNLIEGRFLKLFKKARLDKKYGLNFAEFLVSLGEYLQEDNSHKPYHFAYMTDLRNHIKRLNKEVIVDKLLKEFNIEESVKTNKGELVRRYIQCFVDLVEKKDKLRRDK